VAYSNHHEQCPTRGVPHADRAVTSIKPPPGKRVTLIPCRVCQFCELKEDIDLHQRPRSPSRTADYDRPESLFWRGPETRRGPSWQVTTLLVCGRLDDRVHSPRCAFLG
jgi:hypothetical protein